MHPNERDHADGIQERLNNHVKEKGCPSCGFIINFESKLIIGTLELSDSFANSEGKLLHRDPERTFCFRAGETIPKGQDWCKAHP